ncbi:hypothetical protein LAZ40_06895 [Cereibacter sphaeroides]|uniref:hypothetical protein n=1 Tax=Cereibacter sphaeroides TaxID=1063 RepID=UPI001F41012B|nr:hypothetical protein [Cereibacter sphaeroides]MCE6958774.1 hypothetical protein [Cereibacter sphaeroides]MCE6973352.1 hypothetical protein [Cereibacter sphaeroides]
MSYRLRCRIMIEVPGSPDPDGFDLSAAAYARALEEAAAAIRARPAGLRDRLQVIDTVEEDRWVLRSTTAPNIIAKADGGWISAKPSTIDLADTVTSAEAAAMRPGPGASAFWCRPEDVGGLPVLVELASPNGIVTARADARNWLAAIADEDICRELVERSWADCPASRWLVRTLDQEGDPNVRRVAGQPGYRAEPLDVSARFLDPERAMAFLAQCRPELAERIRSHNEAPTP